MTEPLIVYGFWRSNAMYRVRVALNLKGVAFHEVPVDLDKGEQLGPDFLARNPQGAVPALVIGDGPPLVQSLAILEYLDETYPEPPLLPRDPIGRARVRAIAATVACDTHPLIVPRVRHHLTDEFGVGQDGFRRWLAHWVGRGLETIETELARNPGTGRFCYRDQITIADICLTGLDMIRRLFRLDMAAPPTVSRIVEACLETEAFARADPLRQPGAPKD